MFCTYIVTKGGALKKTERNKEIMNATLSIDRDFWNNTVSENAKLRGFSNKNSYIIHLLNVDDDVLKSK